MDGINDAITVGHLITASGGFGSLLIIGGLLMYFVHIAPQKDFRRDMHTRVRELETNQAVIQSKMDDNKEDWKSVVDSIKSLSEAVHDLTTRLVAIESWIKHQKEK